MINLEVTDKKKYNSISNIHRFVVCLIPLAIVAGSFLADLFAIVSSLIFLYLSITNKDWKYYNSKIIKIFFAWCLFLIISSLLSIDPAHSLESSLFYWRHGIFAMSIWYIFDKDKLIKKYFTVSLTIVFLALIFDGYYQYITGFNITGYEYNIVHARLTSFFGDKQILGNFLARLFPLLFALIISTFNSSRTSIALMMFILFSTDVLIYLSGERSAFIYLILSTSMIIILTNNWKKIRIITFFLSMLLILFLTFTNNNLKTRMVEHTINQTNIFSENYVADHELFFISSYKMFLDRPYIGNGSKMYRVICKDENYYMENQLWNSCTTHPHNSYFQLLAETGLAGTIPVIFLFFYISYKLIYHFISKFKSSVITPLTDTQVCLLIAIFITLWPLNTNLNFFGNWINVIYFLPVGILLSSMKENLNNE